jgi:hypothetical protein
MERRGRAHHHLGLAGLTSTVEHGNFYCPNCQAREDYALKQVRSWFTLYFIPIFPLGGGQRYVECSRCRQAYKESVLEYEPPGESAQVFARVYDELREGRSVDALKRTLMEAGMDEAEAEDALVKMCEGRPKQCVCGQRLHPEVETCAYCGGKP